MILTKEKVKLQGKKSWLKKLTIAGFLFFLLKGLAWIGVGVWAWWNLKK